MVKLNAKIGDEVVLNSWSNFGYGYIELAKVTGIGVNGEISIDVNNQKYGQDGMAIGEEEDYGIVYSYLSEFPEGFLEEKKEDDVKRKAREILKNLIGEMTVDQAMKIIEDFGKNNNKKGK